MRIWVIAGRQDAAKIVQTERGDSLERMVDTYDQKDYLTITQLRDRITKSRNWQVMTWEDWHKLNDSDLPTIGGAWTDGTGQGFD